MSLVADDEVALRRAALTLHALAEPDREWVLAGLDAGSRDILRALLVELRGLGIPSDAELAQVDDAARAAVPPAAITPDGWLRSLDDQGVKALAQVLSAEPPQVTGTLVALADWPWRARLLEALGDRARLEPSVTPGAPAARLGRELAALLQVRWQEALAGLPSPEPERATSVRAWWLHLRGRA
jgi:hypothetical protein